MKREECIEIVKKYGWDYLIFNHTHDIEEEFWEEFISEVDINNLLQRRRFSDDFMEKFKNVIGDVLYRKYKAIYCLLDLSNKGESVYSDTVKTYLNNLHNKSELSYILRD